METVGAVVRSLIGIVVGSNNGSLVRLKIGNFVGEELIGDLVGTYFGLAVNLKDGLRVGVLEVGIIVGSEVFSSIMPSITFMISAESTLLDSIFGKISISVNPNTCDIRMLAIMLASKNDIMFRNIRLLCLAFYYFFMNSIDNKKILMTMI